jgi:long-subunit acyl-CoA synthetase (AMP-forming)
MITQKALVSGVSGAFVMVTQSGFEINDDDSVLSYLTLAHIFGRIIEELALAAGAHIGYWRVRFILKFVYRGREKE